MLEAKRFNVFVYKPYLISTVVDLGRRIITHKVYKPYLISTVVDDVYYFFVPKFINLI